ncbi:Uu.00g132020.m01.CDS01 [Anthostomella pinea]|uniref:Uu.00g132020.m01.CDS01 n=1 Tax=Anthostomella pinea TaxID=933095 RepID=A0AAI8VJ11_9PEZI|nr:Uu.00g132020.m01.CDS01 [Anthostomella pinea]
MTPTEKNTVAGPRKSTPSAVSTALKVAIALLMVDAVIELSFISSMVAWLNRTVIPNVFHFNYNGETYAISGVPKDILTDQGHTSNGAAGTAFVLIGLGGIVALWLRSWSQHRAGDFATFGRNLYFVWVALNILALFLTIGALGYVFAVTNARKGQTIDVAAAANLNGAHPYDLQSWTPQSWFAAVHRLDLVGSRYAIQSHLTVMRGWQYNLIPLFLIQLVETVLAMWDCHNWRRKTQAVEYQGTSNGGW